MEIERKFLVRKLPPEVERAPSTRIEQGYIAIADDGTEVRVRRRDGAATLTVKGGSGGTRLEEEIAIDAERFARLWPLTEGHRLEKTQHLIPTRTGLTIELDVYSGVLTGLMVERPAPAWEAPQQLHGRVRSARAVLEPLLLERSLVGRGGPTTPACRRAHRKVRRRATGGGSQVRHLRLPYETERAAGFTARRRALVVYQ